MAPPFEFLERRFLPQLAKTSAEVELELLRPGFHPAGGGRVRAVISCSGSNQRVIRSSSDRARAARAASTARSASHTCLATIAELEWQTPRLIALLDGRAGASTRTMLVGAGPELRCSVHLGVLSKLTEVLNGPSASAEPPPRPWPSRRERGAALPGARGTRGRAPGGPADDPARAPGRRPLPDALEPSHSTRARMPTSSTMFLPGSGPLPSLRRRTIWRDGRGTESDRRPDPSRSRSPSGPECRLQSPRPMAAHRSRSRAPARRHGWLMRSPVEAAATVKDAPRAAAARARPRRTRPPVVQRVDPPRSAGAVDRRPSEPLRSNRTDHERPCGRGVRELAGDRTWISAAS